MNLKTVVMIGTIKQYHVLECHWQLIALSQFTLSSLNYRILSIKLHTLQKKQIINALLKKF